jgi:hypothetical protein
MKTSIRYGDYLQALVAGRHKLSLIALASPGGRDQWGLPMPRPAELAHQPAEGAESVV